MDSKSDPARTTAVDLPWILGQDGNDRQTQFLSISSVCTHEVRVVVNFYSNVAKGFQKSGIGISVTNSLPLMG